jgi:allophanate hydrolase subunit 2
VVSFTLANALLNNLLDAPCLELSVAHLVLRANADLTISWVGAGASHESTYLSSGDIFTAKTPNQNCRSYVALSGGVQATGPIRRGSAIQPFELARKAPIRKLADPPSSLASGPFRIVKGPQASAISAARPFQVSSAIDRTGIRMEPMADLAHSFELPSGPACVGAVQITPNGSAIVLGPDGPTIGGYPKVAIVCAADIPRLAQLRPGDRISFVEIDLDEARRLKAETDAELRKRVRLLQLASN